VEFIEDMLLILLLNKLIVDNRG